MEGWGLGQTGDLISRMDASRLRLTLAPGECDSDVAQTSKVPRETKKKNSVFYVKSLNLEMLATNSIRKKKIERKAKLNTSGSRMEPPDHACVTSGL